MCQQDFVKPHITVPVSSVVCHHRRGYFLAPLNPLSPARAPAIRLAVALVSETVDSAREKLDCRYDNAGDSKGVMMLKKLRSRWSNLMGALCLLWMALPNQVFATDNIHLLRFELAGQETVAGQLEVLARMDRMRQNRAIHASSVNILVSVLTSQPVVSEREGIAFIKGLLEQSELAPEAIRAMADRVARPRRLAPGVEQLLVDLILEYQRRQVLSADALASFGDMLSPGTSAERRETAWLVLERGGQLDAPVKQILDDFARVVESELPLTERQKALGVLVNSASAGRRSDAARRALYRTATQDPNDDFRLLAWPSVIERSRDRSSRQSLQFSLSRQLRAPTENTPATFDDADSSVREQAIELLLELAPEPRHSMFIDELIDLVERYSSPAATEEIIRLRRLNELTDEQRERIAALDVADETIGASLAAVSIANFQPQALASPLHIALTSKNPAEMTGASEALLADFPTGAVPKDVADAAYRVLQSGGANPAAAELLARGDLPFAEIEARALSLVGQFRQPTGEIINILSRLHNAADTEFLVRNYAPERAIKETFRSALVGQLYVELRDGGGNLERETIAALLEFGRSAENYFSVKQVIQVLGKVGVTVPWSIRVKDKSFRWAVLGWILLTSWIIAGVASVAWLLRLLLPSTDTGISGAGRLGSLAVWFVLAVPFAAANGLGIIFSLGHNSTPNPGGAAPFYLASLVLSLIAAAVAFSLWRRRPPLVTEATGPVA